MRCITVKLFKNEIRITYQRTRKIMIETRDEWISLYFDNVKNKKGINTPETWSI